VTWSLSYRIRAIALIAALVGASICATVWISTRSTVAQISESVDSQQAEINMITARIRQYGLDHGVWIGVSRLVRQLGAATSQRIKLTTQDGEVVVDTDTLAGRAARPTVDRAPVAIVPRPRIDLHGLDPKSAVGTALGAIAEYRANAAMTACLTQQSIGFSTNPGPYGLSRISYDAAAAHEATCLPGPPSGAATKGDVLAADKCVSNPKRSNSVYVACLETVFQQQTVTSDPVTLELYIGYRGSPTLRVDTRRIIVTAIPILLIAVLCAALLSRRVLRPVDAVIRASRGLEAGERGTRVPVRGHDEMATLAHSFNRMADAVADSERQQRQLVADIAHELRTPLANIRGYLEALKDGVMPPSQEIFESLHEEALLQQRTIDDLNDLSLADRSRLVDQRVRTDLADLVRTACAAHAVRAVAAGVLLRPETGETVEADADPDRMRQALGNLLTNALRATDPGGTVTVRAARGEDGSAVISVADTGHGIEEAHLAHLFERFWRADRSRARGTGGSGLGLAITREIVRAHGGTIEVTSALGEGTTFTLTLPPPPPAPTGSPTRRS